MTIPALGEIKGATAGQHRYIWAACEICGKERWVRLFHNKPISNRCQRCGWVRYHGSKNGNWKGGQVTNTQGYILVYNPGHPQALCHGYVRRSRLVLEQKLGYQLPPDIICHHLNGIKTDDRPENIIGLTRPEHNRVHSFLDRD